MGSGKSSLLAALLGEMHLLEGLVCRSDDIGYCGQQPYLHRGTVRDNVLFGRSFDASKYERALRSCALEADLAAWPLKDATEIGERGVAVSGGQRARIALARAVYARPDLCLLDEPLASLDPQTCAHVWERALRGTLRRSAVVLSTSSVQLALKADVVLLLDGGRVLQFGPPAELATAPGLFGELVAETEMDLTMAAISKPALHPRPTLAPALPVEATPRRELDAAWAAAKGRKGQQVTSEIYLCYARQFGRNGLVFCLAMLLFVAAQAGLVLCDCWLGRWAALPPEAQRDVAANLGGFALLSLLAACAVALQAGCWPLLCLRASSKMHGEGLRRVLYAPYSVGLTLPHGQLLSRFSKDLDVLDTRLPSLMAQALTCAAALLSALAAIVASSPLMLPAVFVSALAFRRVVVVYRPVAADAARLVTTLHGPVVAHALETYAGREYLRAFGQRPRACKRALQLLDAAAKAQMLNVALQRWCALQLELLGAGVLLCVSMACTAMRDKAPLGLSGLALTYALTLTALGKYLVNNGTRADAQFASVERIHKLMELPSESAAEGSGLFADAECSCSVGFGDLERGCSCHAAKRRGPPLAWPQRGLLELHGYQPAAYALNGAPALQPQTLTFRPGEHVALIGRSGAGKSTLLAGLTRLLPRARGSLFLDGWASEHVSLKRWRAAIRCIPQQPLLHSGTIASNIDPEGTLPVASLWEALRLAGIDGVVRELPQQLQTPLHALGGAPLKLSASQRQLLVLARLLARRDSTHMVLLDEPAAGLEHQVGLRLHGAVHEHLSRALCITVTHRVLPVLHLFSRVLVFSGGCCVEDGAPADLLASQSDGGELAQLLAEAPARMQAHVQRMLALQRSKRLPAVDALLERVKGGGRSRSRRATK
eukprot:TRINITY_DN4249_c0_g3_i1.p1 TRINITY_DN4249_c0_g3~~TRINITY_DN4249_c0_g3_i1.p1  ORF type:complete len:968 (-),score=217.34 TRINITY_DN4249_c0_g3_i1:98-2761(-)